MRIGMNLTGTETVARQRNAAEKGKRFSGGVTTNQAASESIAWAAYSSSLREADDEEKEVQAGENSQTVKTGGRSEAEKIYEAAVAGKGNPLASLREISKVPYGALAKDGVIEYNGVVFVCDEKTNSICLGDMTDKKNVLNIPLSGGGHLKVNRNSLGLLSKAASMFSPEDLNLIMRAIAQDTKIQSVQKEIEDAESEIGNQLREEGDSESPMGEEES